MPAPPSPPPPSPPSGKCSDGKKWAKIAKGAGCSNFDTIQLTDTWYKEGCVGFSYATNGHFKEWCIVSKGKCAQTDDAN